MPESPRIVAHPELLGGEQLTLLRPGLRKLWWAFLPVPVVTVLGIMLGGQNWTMGLAVLGIWIAYAALVWSDHRAFMRATDDLLEVRTLRSTHGVLGSQVRRVVHQYNGRSPDFQLVLEDGRKVWVPASRLEKGHSTLFTWLDMHAPQAELDKKSAWWREVMIDDGLI